MKPLPCCLFVTCSIIFLPRLAGQEASTNRGGLPVSQIATAQERQSAADAFKQSFDSAKTPEEKRAVIEQWRKQNQALMNQRPPAKSQQQVLAELRAQAADNPKMTRRVEQMAQRLDAMETLKTASAALAKAKGNEKVKAQEDLLKARENLAKLQRDQMAAMKADREARQSAEAARPPTPEMAAIRAKADQRKQEIEQLKESLKQATPEERAKIMTQWRAKQEADLTARKQEIPSKMAAPQPSTKPNP